MAASPRILFNYNLKRCISSTAIYGKNYAAREGRFMRKLVQSDVGKRKWYVNKSSQMTPTLPQPTKLTGHVNRRMNVLNKLFMSQITDLMVTGEASTELLGRSIEISHVKINSDFRVVRVFWSSKNTDLLEETEKILNESAYRIRHELTQRRVIGQVPLIQFVKNKQLEALAQLDNRLMNADYGEDFEPIGVPTITKPVPMLTSNFPQEVKEKILKLERSKVEMSDNEGEINEEEDYSPYDVKLPPMRHDILGLDHHAVISRVQHSLKKSRNTVKNRLMNRTSFYPDESPTPLFNLPSAAKSKEEAQAFTDFLLKRQEEEKRKLRRERIDEVSVYHLRRREFSEPGINMDNNETVELVDDDDVKHFDGFEDAGLETLDNPR